MKIYLVADDNPCFDCNTIAYISIHDSLSIATDVAWELIASNRFTRLSIFEAELNSELCDAKEVKAIYEVRA